MKQVRIFRAAQFSASISSFLTDTPMSNLEFVQQTNWLNSLFLTSHGQTPNSPRMSPPVVASSLPRWSDPGEAISAFFWVFEDGKMDETHICQCNSMDIWYKYVYIYMYIYWLIYDIWSILGNISIHIWCYLPKRSLKATKNIHKLSTIDYFFQIWRATAYT